VVVTAASRTFGALVFGASGISIPCQGRAKATAVGAVAHVLANLGNVLRGVCVPSADPNDCAPGWSIGGLTNGLRTGDG
jgi:hypothetical protein